MTTKELEEAIDNIFKGQGYADPYIAITHQDCLCIDGYLTYEQVVELGEVVKKYLESNK